MIKTLGVAAAGMAAMALAGCATMDDTPPTAEQKAACEKMLSEMGEGATHSHGSDKSGAVNSMGMTHAQCRSMLKK
ncbi:MAG: hydroxylase [Phenylobacterium sp.]|uniref:hydroxylase n=1 Tax=Phenylobacterium sp. TaxID=1871053 RepID=UPI001209AEE7|nr:hydroxylase [Phenylobacterium sp.]TAJ71742.1 MAG: hydroxylase [Phenylobacterium sp.]